MKTFIQENIIDPLRHFIHDSKAIGITLLSCTVVSLLLANWNVTASNYLNLFTKGFDGTTEHHIHIGFLSLPNSPLLIINDFLMALFFLLAGMEIKREMVNGELSSIKQAALPVAAALGGMLFPAIIFLLFNKGTHFQHGWAIPTATDIAFTLGVASLLGNRVPVALKVFLTALAIIDDLGAIAVIALFYGSQVAVGYLLGCAGCIIALLIINKWKKKFDWLNIIIGVLLWYCMFNSGIHATVAGVVFAFLIPVNLLEKFEAKLHIPVYFIIMPLFILANTAIALPANSLQALNSTLSLGIIAGLVIGKPLGICAACYLFTLNKWAELPTGTNWPNLAGASILAGIGFTMSIFIATLAFDEQEQITISKISVLTASFIAMAAGYVWMMIVTRK